MKQLDPVPLPGYGAKGGLAGPCGPEPGPEPEPGLVPGDDFPTCLAEAIDILVDRAMRHGLVEVAHLLEVAALAARDSAPSPADRPCQPEHKRDGPPSSPA